MAVQEGPLFGLPREVRDQISAYVLIPGTVYIRPLRLGACHASFHVDEEPQIGFGYLTTCQQACEEGQTMFYTHNIFFLPPGSLRYTHCWQRELRMEHKQMIRSLGIRMGPSDLHIQELCVCDELAGPFSGRPEGMMLETDIRPLLNYDEDRVTQGTRALIEATGIAGTRGMWQDKLRCMRDCSWGSVQEIIVENKNSKVAFERDALPLDLDVSENTGDEKLDEILDAAIESVKAVVRARLDVLQLADTDAWVEAGAPLGVFGGNFFHICQ